MRAKLPNASKKIKTSQIRNIKTPSDFVCQKKNSHLPAGELSSPVDTLDSSSQDNLQNTRTNEVQVQLNHFAEN